MKSLEKEQRKLGYGSFHDLFALVSVVWASFLTKVMHVNTFSNLSFP